MLSINPGERNDVKLLEHVSASVFGNCVSLFRKRKEAELHGVFLTPGLLTEGSLSLEHLYRIGAVHSVAIAADEDKRLDSIIFTGETFAVNESLFGRTDFIGDPEFIALVKSIDSAGSRVGESVPVRTENTAPEAQAKRDAEYYRDALDAEACLILELHAGSSSRVKIRDVSGAVVKTGPDSGNGLKVRGFCELGKLIFAVIPSMGIREFASLAPQPGRRFSSFILCPSTADRYEFVLCFFNTVDLQEHDVIRLCGLV